MKRSTKIPKWRRAQDKKKRVQKRIQLIVGVGFLVFLGLLITGGFLYQKAKVSIWDGKSRLGVIHQDESQIYLEVLLSDQKRLIIIRLPFDLVVEVPFGYGEYQFEKIYKLGELDGNGGQLLTRSGQDLMGLSIKGYKYLNISNLTWWDKVRIWWFRAQVKKTINLNLVNEIGLDETLLSDGSRILDSSQVLIDELVNQYLFDETIVKEGLSIAVLNASGVANLANTTARIIINLGGEVNTVSNEDRSSQSQIWVKKKDLIESETAKQLSEIFEIQEIKISAVDEYRADIVLVISEDYSKLK